MADDLLLDFVDVLVAPSAPLEPIVRGTETRQPWEIAMDVDLCPVWVLPWHAGLAGVDWEGPPSEELRALILDRPRARRGTARAIEEAAKTTLVGSGGAEPTVTVIARVNDDPRLLTVITRPAETPRPAATKAAMERVCAVWVKLTHIVTEDVLIDADTDITIDASPADELIND